MLNPNPWPNKEAVKLSDIPQKLTGFDQFVEEMKEVIVQGTDKFTGSEADKWETIDVIPLVLGEVGFLCFVLGDILKRVFRYKNQRRSRDLFKIAVWCYLLWKRFHQKEGEL